MTTRSQSAAVSMLFAALGIPAGECTKFASRVRNIIRIWPSDDYRSSPGKQTPLSAQKLFNLCLATQLNSAGIFPSRAIEIVLSNAPTLNMSSSIISLRASGLKLTVAVPEVVWAAARAEGSTDFVCACGCLVSADEIPCGNIACKLHTPETLAVFLGAASTSEVP